MSSVWSLQHWCQRKATYLHFLLSFLVTAYVASEPRRPVDTRQFQTHCWLSRDRNGSSGLWRTLVQHLLASCHSVMASWDVSYSQDPREALYLMVIWGVAQAYSRRTIVWRFVDGATISKEASIVCVYRSGQKKFPLPFQNCEHSTLHFNKDTAMEWEWNAITYTH